jgi:hypothetical protein
MANRFAASETLGFQLYNDYLQKDIAEKRRKEEQARLEKQRKKASSHGAFGQTLSTLGSVVGAGAGFMSGGGVPGAIAGSQLGQAGASALLNLAPNIGGTQPKGDNPYYDAPSDMQRFGSVFNAGLQAYGQYSQAAKTEAMNRVKNDLTAAIQSQGNAFKSMSRTDIQGMLEGLQSYKDAQGLFGEDLIGSSAASGIANNIYDTKSAKAGAAFEMLMQLPDNEQKQKAFDLWVDTYGKAHKDLVPDGAMDSIKAGVGEEVQNKALTSPQAKNYLATLKIQAEAWGKMSSEQLKTDRGFQNMIKTAPEAMKDTAIAMKQLTEATVKYNETAAQNKTGKENKAHAFKVFELYMDVLAKTPMTPETEGFRTAMALGASGAGEMIGIPSETVMEITANVGKAGSTSDKELNDGLAKGLWATTQRPKGIGGKTIPPLSDVETVLALKKLADGMGGLELSPTIRRAIEIGTQTKWNSEQGAFVGKGGKEYDVSSLAKSQNLTAPEVKEESDLLDDALELAGDAWEGAKSLAGGAGEAISGGFNRLQDWYEKGGDEADIADLAAAIEQAGAQDKQSPEALEEKQAAENLTRSITTPGHQPPPGAEKRPYASPKYPGVEEALGNGKLPKYMNPEGFEEQLVSEPPPRQLPQTPPFVDNRAKPASPRQLPQTPPFVDNRAKPAPPKQLPQTPPFDKNRTTANAPKTVYEIMAQAGRGGETYTAPVPQSPLTAAYKQRHSEVNKPAPPPPPPKPATRGFARPAAKEEAAPQQGPLVDFYKQRHSEVNAPKPSAPAEVAGPDTPAVFKGSVGTGTFPETPGVEVAATAEQQAKIVDNATNPAKLPAGIRDTGIPAIESAVSEKMGDAIDRIQEEVGQYVINEDGSIDIKMIPYLEARRDYHLDNATRLEENAAIIGRFDVPAEVLGEEFAMARVYQQMIDYAAGQVQ